MHPHFIRHAAAAAVCAFAVAAAPSQAQTPVLKYVVTPLGSLDGSVGNTIAQGINNAGQVVGQTRLGPLSSDPSMAFRTGPNRAIKPTDTLGTLGGASSFAYAINASGQVVGDADRADGVRRAFRTDPGQAMVDLGTLVGTGTVTGSNSSGARNINDAGVVVGFARVPTNICASVSRAFRTASNSVIDSATDDLGTLVPPTISCPTLRSSIAWGVNSAGTVVGSSATTFFNGTPDHAFRYSGSGPMVDSGALYNGIRATSFAVNERGEAVGETIVNFTTFETHAFLDGGSGLLDLGDLGGGYASAQAINTPLSGGDSQVVGRSATAAPALHGFVWTRTEGMVDLNTRVATNSPWVITFGRGINGRGQIVADATKDGVPFVYHAVRLDPLEMAPGILKASLSDPDYALTAGQIANLSDKLDNALLSIQAGANKQAVNQLNAFISAVKQMWKTGKISSATAAALTDGANAIIAVLL